MERIVHKARDQAEARRWDIEQQRRMTPRERQRAARELKRRAYPGATRDVRDWHRSK